MLVNLEMSLGYQDLFVFDPAVIYQKEVLVHSSPKSQIVVLFYMEKLNKIQLVNVSVLEVLVVVFLNFGRSQTHCFPLLACI